MRAPPSALTAPGSPPARGGARVAALLIGLWSAAGVSPAGAQDASTSAGSGTGHEVPLRWRTPGATVEEVRVDLLRSGGNEAKDGAVLRAVRKAVSGLEGRPLDPVALQGRLGAVRSRLRVAAVDWRPLSPNPAEGLIVVVEVDASAPPESDTPGPVFGLLPASFPTLHQDEQTYATAIIGGGFGLYSDGYPYFGQRAQFRGADLGANTTWTEGYIELGLGGAAQLGETPLYAYGAVTGMGTWTQGEDPFTDEQRWFMRVEKAYLGLLYAPPDEDLVARLTVGRQSFTLNDGFLVCMVRQNANAGERGASYLGPRVTSQLSGILELRAGRWEATAFYIDPDELGAADSRTLFAGGNVRCSLTEGLTVDATGVYIIDSAGTYTPPSGEAEEREGLTTVSAHARWRAPLGLAGVWLESEAAHQFHLQENVAAWAGYGLVGYRAEPIPWHPSLSYRFAVFSGDDPSSRTYERFDPLLSTGMGFWLQGLSFGKVTSNANLVTHRLQANLELDPTLNLTFEYFYLVAEERNNAGSAAALARLAHRELGHELTATIRWALSRHAYLQGIASVALPGQALKAIGADEPWTTLQASLYWSW